MVVFIVFKGALRFNKGEAEARTLAFATLVFANMMLIVTNLSWSQNIVRIIRAKNVALWVVLGGATTALLLILCVPFLRNLFHFSKLSPDSLLIAFGSGIMSLLWFEGLKFLLRRSNK